MQATTITIIILSMATIYFLLRSVFWKKKAWYWGKNTYAFLTKKRGYNPKDSVIQKMLVKFNRHFKSNIKRESKAKLKRKKK